MALALVKSALPSRAIRKTATGTPTGRRRLNPLGSDVVDTQDGSLLGKARRVAGWVSQVFGFAWDSATDIWDAARDIFEELWYFDWNVSAEEQMTLLKNQANQVLLQLSELVGATVGWATVGAIGMGIAIYIPVIGSKVLATAVKNAVIQEAVQDLLGRLSQIGMQATRMVITQALTWSWIGIRNMYRAGVRAASRGVAAARGAGSLKRLNEYYAAQDAQPWTFQQKFRDKVEELPDWLQQYFEAAIDGFQDSFWEGGYVVAAELDRAWDQQAEQADLVLKPDKDSDETFYLYGPQQQVIQQAHQLLQNHRTLANRDVGYVVGDNELVGRIPPSRKTLKLFFTPYERPPWNRRGEQRIRSGIVLENLRANVTWVELKQACRRYTTGSVRVTAFLDNGRQMWLLASTEKEGQDKLRELVTLTTSTIMRFSAGSQTLEAQEILARTRPGDRARVRPLVPLYPAYAYFFARVKWIEGREGAPERPEGVTPEGQPYYTLKSRFNLYPENQPENFPVLL